MSVSIGFKKMNLPGNEAGVIEVRQQARHMAREMGFDLADQTRIATAVSEIARLSGGGTIHLRLLAEQSRIGLECTLTSEEGRWQNPIPQRRPVPPQQVLGGVQRLVDELLVGPSDGVPTITLRKWRRQPGAAETCG